MDERRWGRKRWGLAFLLTLGAFLAVACRDDLNAPVDCPAICPGGQPPVLETVLPARDSMDSSFVGYVRAGLGISLRISNGLPVSEDRGIVLFLPRPDSITVGDSTRSYVVDSVVFGLTLQARDTLVDSLRFLIYRLPINIDTTTTFADIAPSLVPANVLDTIFVPDSIKAGLIQSVLTGPQLAQVLIPAQDSGKIAIAIALEANAPTGARIASIAATGSPRFTTFVTANNVTDSTLKKQVINRFPSFTSFVTQNPPPPDNTLLAIGGGPSARARLKFDLPRNIRDSVTILRATLELTPNSAILGLPNDPATLQVIGVIGDLGAKSPLISGGNSIGLLTLENGTTDTVEVDVTRLVRLWQTKNGLPPVIFVAIGPEAATFTEPVFKSTRSASGGPRLRITYYEKFPFQRF
ncbi:MAG: hypothetical protein ABI836_04175 [Gemmatimonadota bacterium]